MKVSWLVGWLVHFPCLICRRWCCTTSNITSHLTPPPSTHVPTNAITGIDHPANVYFCELDVFYALVGITKETEPSTLQQQLSSHSQPQSQSLSPQSQSPNNLVLAYEWITRAYRNAVLCKGIDSSAAIRCQQFQEVLKACIPWADCGAPSVLAYLRILRIH